MSNPAIPRDEVHTLAEACAEGADGFRNTAQRLLKGQKRLTNFMQKNMVHLEPETREVVLYMYAVSLRIFEQLATRTIYAFILSKATEATQLANATCVAAKPTKRIVCLTTPLIQEAQLGGASTRASCDR